SIGNDVVTLVAQKVIFFLELRQFLLRVGSACSYIFHLLCQPLRDLLAAIDTGFKVALYVFVDDRIGCASCDCTFDTAKADFNHLRIGKDLDCQAVVEPVQQFLPLCWRQLRQILGIRLYGFSVSKIWVSEEPKRFQNVHRNGVALDDRDFGLEPAVSVHRRRLVTAVQTNTGREIGVDLKPGNTLILRRLQESVGRYRPKYEGGAPQNGQLAPGEGLPY